MKNVILKILLFGALSFSSFGLIAQEEKPQSQALSLDELLELVKSGKFAESEEATKRENRFNREKNRQQTLLANAKAERAKIIIDTIATYNSSGTDNLLSLKQLFDVLGLEIDEEYIKSIKDIHDIEDQDDNNI